MTSTQASAPDLPGRWGRKHSPVPGGCQYCGTACGQRDCPPVVCLACGSRQCGGTHGGRCIVCSGGLLHPFDPLTGAPLLCGYADCQAPAVSAAPRIGRVCGGHLDRVTLRAQGTWRQSLANWIQDKIAERDIGGPDLIWIGPAGPAPAVRLQAGELRPGDRIYTASRWRTITGTRTESAGRAILTCDPEPGRLGPPGTASQLNVRSRQRFWVHRPATPDHGQDDGEAAAQQPSPARPDALADVRDREQPAASPPGTAAAHPAGPQIRLGDAVRWARLPDGEPGETVEERNGQFLVRWPAADGGTSSSWHPASETLWAGRRVPVPPDGAARAARYVHEAMTRITDDLASRQPGGRNAAAYAAGLKAGSLLGAARATPGGEQAAAAWTDEEAEQALMDAAERNGYTGKDGPAEALRAIRSGLRNGLRNPRALPDFTARPAADRRQPPRRPASSGPARPQRSQATALPGRRAGRLQDLVPGDIRRQIEAADKEASARRRTAIATHQRALERHSRAATAATAADVERTRAEADAAHQAYTRDGRHVTGRHHAAMLRWATAIAAQREQPAADPAPAGDDSARAQASRAAAAANEAYKAGNLDQAQSLTDQAAALDPPRARLWQQHRNEIAARRLILAARAAHTEGDRQRAAKLLHDARQFDPRMRTLWDGSLSAQPPARQARGHDTTGPVAGGTASAARAAAQPGRARQHQPAAIAPAAERAPQAAWPSAPARSEPDRSAPAPPQPDTKQPLAQRPAAAAAPREPRTSPSAAVEHPATDADPGDGPARRPSPNPPGQAQARSRTRQAARGTGTAPQAAEASTSRSPAAPDAPVSADWRDAIIGAARQPWQQPGPAWPHNPALHRSPEAPAPGAGIEAGQ